MAGPMPWQMYVCRVVMVHHACVYVLLFCIHLHVHVCGYVHVYVYVTLAHSRLWVGELYYGERKCGSEVPQQLCLHFQH